MAMAKGEVAVITYEIRRDEYGEVMACDSCGLPVPTAEFHAWQAKESLKLVVYYGLSRVQERNVISYITPKHSPPFCIVHPDDLQMAISNTPELLWKHIEEME